MAIQIVHNADVDGVTIQINGENKLEAKIIDTSESTKPDVIPPVSYQGFYGGGDVVLSSPVKWGKVCIEGNYYLIPLYGLPAPKPVLTDITFNLVSYVIGEDKGDRTARAVFTISADKDWTHNLVDNPNNIPYATATGFGAGGDNFQVSNFEIVNGNTIRVTVPNHTLYNTSVNVSTNAYLVKLLKQDIYSITQGDFDPSLSYIASTNAQ